MQSGTHAPVDLERIDPARNMARFYQLSVQPTLFGEQSVIRCWGRIGTQGRSMMVTFATEDEAVMAYQKLVRSKEAKGYLYLRDAEKPES